ncbi:MAG: hypothetical protein ACI35V_08070 [Sphingobacterium composti]|uniref:hypothetical protein n=1 Tax=Sphingobacterium composti TaxID=363260 RepID=UPI001357FED8|nr:hypothetical protein [Sphingobacterium composti Ten et al. 2007 non Yoo et al. 2007]
MKNFNEIAILFENKPIKDNLIYIKGCFINDGEIDIEGEKIERPINISIPENYNWINCKITGTSPDLKCSYEIKDSKNLQFDFGLFRKNEFYQIEAIIEATEEIEKHNNIFDELKFTHRISQTQKIFVTNLLSENEIKRKKGKIKSNLWVTGLQMLIPTILSIVFFVFLKSAELHYREVGNNNEITEYKVTPKRDNTIKLENTATGKEKNISIFELQDKNKYTPFIPSKTILQRILEGWYIFVFWIILVIFSIGFDYWELRKSNKIYDILKNSV